MGICWVTIIFSILYVPYYHFMYPEKLPENALMATMAAEAEAAKVEAEAAPEKTGDIEAELKTAFAAGGWEEAGKQTFNTYCAACHGPDGGGLIGPNFTDDFYIHGGKLGDIVRVTTEGVPDKGMVPWKTTLKPNQIHEVSFYIRSLRGTTPATPKDPQGQKVDEDGNFVD